VRNAFNLPLFAIYIRNKKLKSFHAPSEREVEQRRSSCRMPGKRQAGVAFSLGYFYLGHAREK
jgi:hypothetical protein